MLCALSFTHLQFVSGGRESVIPDLATCRQEVAETFQGDKQHDVFEFLEQFFRCVRKSEIEANRFGIWGGVKQYECVASHQERLFSFLVESRRRCSRCQSCVRSWYDPHSVLRLIPKEHRSGYLSVTEMFFDYLVD